MVAILMVRLFRLLGLCLAAVLAVACDKIPLFAPSQSTITLTAGQRVLPLNASVEVTAVVVEPSGTPVQNGTAVRFSTTLGRVDPVEVETRNGVATTTFHAGTTSGVADVRATSGSAGGTSSGTGTTTTTATNVVTFTIGAAAADTVTIRTNPSSVPASGGTVEVSAVVLDANGQGISGIPVTFSANHGTLTDIVSVSNANGVATVGLTTNVETSVSATAGSKSTATAAVVTVRGTPAIAVACQGSGSAGTSCTQTVGQPITFTIKKATGSSALVSAVLAFGDGGTSALGTLSSEVTVSHTYSSA
ncbi:MAG: Ig-like domain-containing protein, partial [Vicinamibacterales bacterium]